MRKSGYTIFPPKDRRKLPKEHDYRLFCLFRTNCYSVYSVNSAIESRIDGILFRSFRNQNRSQKNTITVNSVYSHSGIVPKEWALNTPQDWLSLNAVSVVYKMSLCLLWELSVKSNWFLVGTAKSSSLLLLVSGLHFFFVCLLFYLIGHCWNGRPGQKVSL